MHMDIVKSDYDEDFVFWLKKKRTPQKQSHQPTED